MEYALLAALIAIVIVAAVTLFGRGTSGLFLNSCNSLVQRSGDTC